MDEKVEKLVKKLIILADEIDAKGKATNKERNVSGVMRDSAYNIRKVNNERW